MQIRSLLIFKKVLKCCTKWELMNLSASIAKLPPETHSQVGFEMLKKLKYCTGTLYQNIDNCNYYYPIIRSVYAPTGMDSLSLNTCPLKAKGFPKIEIKGTADLRWRGIPTFWESGNPNCLVSNLPGLLSANQGRPSQGDRGKYYNQSE